jgi:hypothetical protein
MRLPTWALVVLLLVAGCAASPQITDDSGCTSCHGTIAARHALSGHARATESPVFQALVARASGSTRAFCNRCHAPGGGKGIGCLTCHRAIGNQGTANARFIEGEPDEMLGPYDVSSPAHGARKHAFVTSAELCGTCHQVEGGGAFHETPYDEWKGSPAKAQGITCARCHMARKPGDPTSGFEAQALAPGSALRDVGDHAFVGPGPELLADAASLDVVADGSHLRVTLGNRNAGHALPSGTRFLRRLTLEVDVDGAPADRIELGDRMLEGSNETLDPLAATALEVHALDAGATRTFDLRPAGTHVEVRLVYRKYDPRILEALSLDPGLAEAFTMASRTVDL